MPTVRLDAGTIYYDVTGPAEGRPVVFIHGYAMASSLWGPLGARLGARGLRCFAPTWPIGSHPEPLRPGADRTLPGLAAIVDAFLAALGLDDVVLVGNDTGGLVAQLVAVAHPDRLGALVLTSCDAFEHFPPPVLKPLILASRTRLTFRAAMQPLRSAAARRRAYGALSHSDVDDLAAQWVKPALENPAIAEDLRVLTASMRQETSVDAAAGSAGSPGPRSSPGRPTTRSSLSRTAAGSPPPCRTRSWRSSRAPARSRCSTSPTGSPSSSARPRASWRAKWPHV